MSNVAAKIASVLFLGAAAGAMWTMFPQRAVLAADNCQTVPTDETPPQGQHWYYHIERGTGRHCWYLRGGDARTDKPVSAEPEKSAPQRAEGTPSRSIADAHAEIPPRPRVAGEAPAAAPSVWPKPASAPPPANAGAASAPVANAPSPLAARWPQSSGAGAPGAAASTASQPSSSQQSPDASLMLADVQDSSTDTAADASQTPATGPAPVARNTGSVQKLLLVAAGALALAGLTGSAVYRFGRRRRRNHWLREREGWKSGQNPNTPPWLEPRFANANSIPDLDETRRAAEESGFSVAMSEGDQTDERVEKIEEYLARLTRQLQEEVNGTSAKRADRNVRRAEMVVPHGGEEAPGAVPDDASYRRENQEAPTSQRRAKARSTG